MYLCTYVLYYIVKKCFMYSLGSKSTLLMKTEVHYPDHAFGYGIMAKKYVKKVLRQCADKIIAGITYMDLLLALLSLYYYDLPRTYTYGCVLNESRKFLYALHFQSPKIAVSS